MRLLRRGDPAERRAAVARHRQGPGAPRRARAATAHRPRHPASLRRRRATRQHRADRADMAFAQDTSTCGTSSFTARFARWRQPPPVGAMAQSWHDRTRASGSERRTTSTSGADHGQCATYRRRVVGPVPRWRSAASDAAASSRSVIANSHPAAAGGSGLPAPQGRVIPSEAQGQLRGHCVLTKSLGPPQVSKVLGRFMSEHRADHRRPSSAAALSPISLRSGSHENAARLTRPRPSGSPTPQAEIVQASAHSALRRCRHA